MREALRPIAGDLEPGAIQVVYALVNYPIWQSLADRSLQRDEIVNEFAAREPVLSVVKRLQRMHLKQIHPMHGGSLGTDIIPKFYDALHKERFWYEGKVFGRSLPT